MKFERGQIIKSNNNYYLVLFENKNLLGCIPIVFDPKGYKYLESIGNGYFVYLKNLVFIEKDHVTLIKNEVPEILLSHLDRYLYNLMIDFKLNWNSLGMDYIEEQYNNRELSLSLKKKIVK